MCQCDQMQAAFASRDSCKGIGDRILNYILTVEASPEATAIAVFVSTYFAPSPKTGRV